MRRNKCLQLLLVGFLGGALLGGLALLFMQEIRTEQQTKQVTVLEQERKKLQAFLKDVGPVDGYNPTTGVRQFGKQGEVKK